VPPFEVKQDLHIKRVVVVGFTGSGYIVASGEKVVEQTIHANVLRDSFG
jgi:hypothetical protein